MRTSPEAPPEGSGAEPVFVDSSGRRRRLARNLGIAVGGLLATYLGVLGFGLVTGTDVPMTPWPKPRSSRGAAPSEDESLRPRRPAPSRTPSPTTSRPSSVRSSSATRPTARPAASGASATTTRPGNSQATPPAYGRSKRSHPQKP